MSIKILPTLSEYNKYYKSNLSVISLQEVAVDLKHVHNFIRTDRISRLSLVYIIAIINRSGNKELKQEFYSYIDKNITLLYHLVSFCAYVYSELMVEYFIYKFTNERNMNSIDYIIFNVRNNYITASDCLYKIRIKVLIPMISRLATEGMIDIGELCDNLGVGLSNIGMKKELIKIISDQV